MKAECDALSHSAQNAQMRMQRRSQAASDREQLLRNRTAGNHGFENIGHAAAGGTENVYLDKERDSLQHTARDVARMNEESAAVLGALRSQRRRMEGTGAKLEGVLQGLGVSDQAIRQIRSMNSTDAAIVAAGTALLILLMLYLWFA
jgi:predicted flap endonuclease-1-like 5' DNA nuclease